VIIFFEFFQPARAEKTQKKILLAAQAGKMAFHLTPIPKKSKFPAFFLN